MLLAAFHRPSNQEFCHDTTAPADAPRHGHSQPCREHPAFLRPAGLGLRESLSLFARDARPMFDSWALFVTQLTRALFRQRLAGAPCHAGLPTLTKPEQWRSGSEAGCQVAPRMRQTRRRPTESAFAMFCHGSWKAAPQCATAGEAARRITQKRKDSQRSGVIVLGFEACSSMGVPLNTACPRPCRSRHENTAVTRALLNAWREIAGFA